MAITTTTGRQGNPAGKRSGSLLTDFQTIPLPLPVWLWNCLVIYISISVAWFLIKIGFVILAGLAFFLLRIFG